jgi:hypothetical protein
MVLNGNHMGIKWLYKYGYIKMILNGNNMCYTHSKKTKKTVLIYHHKSMGTMIPKV